MEIKQIKGCSFYMVDLSTYKHEIVLKEDIYLSFENNKPIFKHKYLSNENKQIIQAFTHRYALMKAFTNNKKIK